MNVTRTLVSCPDPTQLTRGEGWGLGTRLPEPLLSSWVGSGHKITRTSPLLVGGIWAQDYQVAEQPYSCLEKLTTARGCMFILNDAASLHACQNLWYHKNAVYLSISYYMA